MKSTEIRTFDKSEIEKKIETEYSSLAELRFQLTNNSLKNTARIKVTRKNIARLKTVLNEKGA